MDTNHPETLAEDSNFIIFQMRTDRNKLLPGRDCLLTLYPTINIEDLTRCGKMRDTTSEQMPRDKDYKK